MQQNKHSQKCRFFFLVSTSLHFVGHETEKKGPTQSRIDAIYRTGGELAISSN